MENNKVVLGIIAAFLLLMLINIIFWFDYVKLRQDYNQAEWECQEIFVTYPKDKYPTIFVNTDYRNHPYQDPQVNSWFCTTHDLSANKTKCIADFPKGAYDDYCIKWALVKYDVIPYYDNEFTNISYIKNTTI